MLVSVAYSSHQEYAGAKGSCRHCSEQAPQKGELVRIAKFYMAKGKVVEPKLYLCGFGRMAISLAIRTCSLLSEHIWGSIKSGSQGSFPRCEDRPRNLVSKSLAASKVMNNDTDASSLTGKI